MKFANSRTWIVGAALALMLGTAACGSDTSSTETSTETATSTDQSTTKIESEELEGALVDSFPQDVPLYDGEIIESKGGMSDVSEEPEWNVAMSTADSIETVDESIRAAYSTNGWTIGSESESGNGYQLIARKTGYIVSITYNDMFSTDININYGVSATG